MENDQKSQKGLSVKDRLDIKTGELLAKTEDLREANESLRLANIEIKRKVEDLKNQKKDLTETEHSLVIANDKLTEANHKLSVMNKESIEIAKDLALANEHIKEQSMRQKEFIDIAAHELRTPTQAILGYTEMIL